MSVKYTRAAGVDIAPMKEQMVLFNPQSNQFCVLNKTAAVVWEMLETPQSLEQLVTALIDRFVNASSQTVEADVRAMMAELDKTACVVTVST